MDYLHHKNTAILKKEFRKSAKRNLFSLHKNKEMFNDKRIVKKLKHLILKRKAKNILAYIPMDSEVDIYPLIVSLRRLYNVKIFIPFIINDTFKIVPFRLPLRKNKYNILETTNSQFSNFNKIDLAVVPILGADIDCKRIGFGKGMYDRFYHSLNKKPYSIFVCRILNLSNINIGNDYDIVGDTIISAGIRKGYYDFFSNNWVYYKWNNLRRICVFCSKKNTFIKSRDIVKTG